MITPTPAAALQYVNIVSDSRYGKRRIHLFGKEMSLGCSSQGELDFAACGSLHLGLELNEGGDLIGTFDVNDERNFAL